MEQEHEPASEMVNAEGGKNEKSQITDISLKGQEC